MRASLINELRSINEQTAKACNDMIEHASDRLPDTAFMCQRWVDQQADGKEFLTALTLHEMDSSSHTKCGLRTNRGSKKSPALMHLADVKDRDWRGNIGREASYTFMCRKCIPLKTKETT